MAVRQPAGHLSQLEVGDLPQRLRRQREVGHHRHARQQRRLSGGWGYGLGVLIMLFIPSLITISALLLQFQGDPWYQPRIAIPILGMLLGNSLTGISLGMNSLLTAAYRDRNAIEARLCLGESRWQALGTVRHDAIHAAFLPIINSMAATGIISLPGMMTGQILAGADPVEAVKYQLLVMFLIGGLIVIAASIYETKFAKR